MLRAWYNTDNILAKIYFGRIFDPAQAKSVFENHCKHVRDVVTKGQLLELGFDYGGCRCANSYRLTCQKVLSGHITMRNRDIGGNYMKPSDLVC
jgi:hypothetical protein